MGEEVSAFLWGYGFEEPGNGLLDLLEAAGICLSQECLELGERLLDRVQVGTVGRQIEQLGTGRADRSPYGRVLMAAEIVHHHDVAWPQDWYQELHHPGEETLGVDGAIQDARRGDAVTPQPGHEGECLALAVGHFGDQALTSGAATVHAGHVRLRPGLINEDQTGRANLALPLLPLPPPPRDISPVLLAGAQAFF